VYYDPARPERSVLRRGPNRVAYLLPVVSVVLLIFGVALVRLGIRLQRPA
jgi:hypothetical protein